eukprot:TRINITY_DN10385_c1_g1_i1.p2 TRINITY_DN10385_c1_g1~~TRINITY_DN10385_c1_g1_i1.p2  ORF type:complete len:131 (-),score=16.59 TRINITY_DN10385_c1_g1_i1:40-432(-)
MVQGSIIDKVKIKDVTEIAPFPAVVVVHLHARTPVHVPHDQDPGLDQDHVHRDQDLSRKINMILEVDQDLELLVPDLVRDRQHLCVEKIRFSEIALIGIEIFVVVIEMGIAGGGSMMIMEVMTVAIIGDF